VAFSRCIRAHGVPDFPDPDSDGGIKIQSGPDSDLAPDSPQMQAAQKACQSLAPGGGSPADRAKAQAAALKFSQCMRAHGLTDFPDPSSDGRLQVGASPGSNLAPDSPAFQAAQKACQSLAPGGGPHFQSSGVAA
jgi:hypothetical protein